MSRLHVVAGAMFGSEGKGHVTAQIITNPETRPPFTRVINIRVAGPNAGHTVVDSKGNAHPLRTIPVAAAVDHDAILYIAPGSEVELDVLEHEVTMLRVAGHPVNHLIVSGEATLLEQKHKDTETSLDLHAKLGSTGKGIGAARADRIMRSARRVIDAPEAVSLINELGGRVVDAFEGEAMMAQWLTDDNSLLVIEGTQGYGLGSHAGMYPTCTSSNARAIDFMAMAGISPWAPGLEEVRIWLVARVFPIRVAGASGPLKGETSWDELGLPIEKTTVTQKVRRVGEWDPELIRRAVVANGGATFDDQHGFLPRGFEVSVALTMADQKIPELYNQSIWGHLSEETTAKLDDLIRSVQDDAGVAVGMITTGPASALVVW